MNEGKLTVALEPAVGFSRPLALTPGQDLKGYLAAHAGRAALFLITCSSVLAVLLIFIFVIREAVPFLMQFSLVEFLTGTSWYPQAEEPKFGALALIVGSLYVTAAALVF